MLPEDVKEKIKFEISEIDSEFESYSLLFDLLELGVFLLTFIILIGHCEALKRRSNLFRIENIQY